MTKAAQELQQLASKVVYSMEWSNIDSLLHFWGKIYVLWNPDLRRCIVALCYNIKVTGYPGCQKTLELVFQNYWWSQILRYIGQYMSICNLCLWTKLVRSLLIGELHPLQILVEQQDTLSVNFMVELSTSSRFDAIMIVVDSVSKRAYFLLIHMTVTTEEAVKLFPYHIWKLHRLSQRVVSDWNPQFIACFIRELY